MRRSWLQHPVRTLPHRIPLNLECLPPHQFLTSSKEYVFTLLSSSSTMSDCVTPRGEGGPESLNYEVFEQDGSCFIIDCEERFPAAFSLNLHIPFSKAKKRQ